jgi:hypothetical protein
MDKTVEINHARLHSIKSLLDRKQIKSRIEISKEVGGTGMFYTRLIKHNIIQKVDGIYKFNESIPITMKLSKTMTDLVRQQSKGYTPKDDKVVIKKSKPVPKKHQDQSKSFELNLFWGLFKLKK